MITGGTAKRVHVDLKKNGLEGVFNVIITKEDHQKVKPEPHQILLACKRLRLKPEECVYVGDMDGDIIAAKRAKVKSIAVTWGFHKEEKLKRTNPDYIVNDFDELIKVIRKIR